VEYLDGLRALAALWVVFSHVWILHHGLFAHPGVIGLLTNWTLYSHLAVDIFIVLSGYCLALPVVRKGRIDGGALGFFGRRARRILPPYYAALALAVGVTVLLERLSTGQWRLDMTALGTNMVLLQDAFLKRDIFDGPLWSIAVEWRIYFLFPIVVWLLTRYGQWAAGLFGMGVAGVLSVAVLRLRPDFLLTCPWYVLLFVFGVCAASQVHEAAGGTSASATGKAGTWLPTAVGSAISLGLAIAAHPITRTDDTDFGRAMPLVDLCAGVLSATCLVGLGLAQRGRVARFLGSRPLAGLGRFSYSVYLIHLPTLRLIDVGFGALPWAGSLVVRSWLLLLVGVPIAIGLSYLFFLAFEKPFMTRRRVPSTGLR